MTHIQDKFILDNQTVVPVDTSTTDGLIEWAKWFEKADRHVANNPDRREHTSLYCFSWTGSWAWLYG